MKKKSTAPVAQNRDAPPMVAAYRKHPNPPSIVLTWQRVLRRIWQESNPTRIN